MDGNSRKSFKPWRKPKLNLIMFSLLTLLTPWYFATKRKSFGSSNPSSTEWLCPLKPIFGHFPTFNLTCHKQTQQADTSIQEAVDTWLKSHTSSNYLRKWRSSGNRTVLTIKGSWSKRSVSTMMPSSSTPMQLFFKIFTVHHHSSIDKHHANNAFHFQMMLTKMWLERRGKHLTWQLEISRALS